MATQSATPASLPDLIGNTPLLRLNNLNPNPKVEIYAKAEWANPGGSVKDRPALKMIREAERAGLLTKDKTIIDATSGNTGIAYAMLGAALGYNVELCLPQNAGTERKRILQAFGAHVVLTDPMAGTDGAIVEVRRRVAESPDKYVYLDQYNNPANWQSHYETTAIEIFNQTAGRITHFVAGLGTSGTFVGVSRRLRELKPEARLISMQPDSPYHGLEGMKHMPTAIVPGIYDPTLADEELEVMTEDAHEMARRLAKHEGWFVGVSAAANIVAALNVASQIESGVIVTILCDSGSRYLSDKFWTEE
ncbi:MAG TPA: cysteine synthase family protein [Blastocatellia bacterium]|nr:cysteine synthase family protein [Blastocatellia bacterium]HMV81598.1 cysteine synthase family protein [Blastocatellia bacterium]HMY73801.1 cysteine synthase family protein [Blastocatellia bacterium]HMZ19885.1 cysteine synthase family protein [Blastocatellia bacterium]HNG31490.1 cysteine synthase family protein [Blastocatellia bacterium]